MLIMFKVKNFTSFKNEVVLDMRATTYKQHSNHIIPFGEEEGLLKTTAIYGANAAGKSNLISAMFFFEQYIFQQFISKKEKQDDILSLELKQKVDLEPFLLANEQNEISEFEIIFSINGKTLQYGFEVSPNMVKSEWYYIDNKKVFERDTEEVIFGKDYITMLKPFGKISSERLHLSVLEYFMDEKEKEIILADFINYFIKEYNVYLEVHFESSVKRVVGGVSINKKLVKNKSYRKKIVNYLKQIDIGIQSLEVQTKLIVDEDTGKETKKTIITTIHNIYNEEGDIVGEKSFELFQESTGTLRFLSYIQNVVEMTERGGVFIVDELSARLHPLLTKLIVDIFQSSSNKKAQLIFTTHDISLLNKDQFRRDEIVFVDKNNQGVSTLYSLSDLKVREDATFNKDYLQGKYGAIPIFDYDEILGGE